MINKDLKFSISGIMLCIITAITAIYLSNYVGITLLEFKKSPLSPIIFAILLGLIINNMTIRLVKLESGFKFCIKYLLKLGIIFLGIRISLLDFVLYGSKSLIVVIPCILCTIILISLLKDKFDVSENLSLLIAVGTSICGATAIVALAPTINAKKTEITYAIANITVFGLLAMFIYPIVANLVFSNDLSIGLFLGSSIHETAQVAGSGLIYAEQYSRQDVVGIAMLTKLVRNTLMVIVIPYLAHRSLSNNNTKPNVSKIFPYFIIGFIVFGLVRTFGDYYFLTQNDSIINNWNLIIHYIKKLAEFLLIIAMAAIGYNTNFKYFKKLGIKPFYLGFIAASMVGLISISIIGLLIV
jgi:uncharacterized integral membrane protein (TIGR00698 family)